MLTPAHRWEKSVPTSRIQRRSKQDTAGPVQEREQFPAKNWPQFHQEYGRTRARFYSVVLTGHFMTASIPKFRDHEVGHRQEEAPGSSVPGEAGW